MHTLTRHYQKLAEQLSRELLALKEKYFLYEIANPSQKSKQVYQLDDGSYVDEDGNPVPGSEGTPAVPGVNVEGPPSPAPAPPPAPGTAPAPAPPPAPGTAPAPAPGQQAGVGQVINIGTPESIAKSVAYKWNPQQAGMSPSAYSVDGANLSDWRSFQQARSALSHKLQLSRQAARSKAFDEMRDLEAKRKSAGLSPEEETRLDFLKTRHKSDHVGKAQRDRMAATERRLRAKEQAAKANQQATADAKAAQTNTAPAMVRTPKGEVPWSVARGEPGTPGVEPAPQEPGTTFVPPQPSPTPSKPFYPTPTGEAPTAPQQTTAPRPTGGQVTTTAQTMTTTPSSQAQGQQPTQNTQEPFYPTPTGQAPAPTPVAAQRPGPGGMSTAPVGSSVTAPAAKPTPATAPTATVPQDEQQGPGPAEKDRAVPTPVDNPYASRQRGRVVTRAAATMSPRVAASTRTV